MGQIEETFPGAFCREKQSITEDFACSLSPKHIGKVKTIVSLYGYSQAADARAVGFHRYKLLFDPRDFASIRDAFITRYGNPVHTSTEEVGVQGKQLANVKMEWSWPGVQAFLDRYDGTPDTSSLHVQTTPALSEYLRRSRKVKAEASKGF